MVMLKVIAILSASTLVVAPPPGSHNRYRLQGQNQNQQDSDSPGGTINLFRNPVVIPPTPILTENPSPISANIQLNSDYSMSQYSPSDGSREINFELARMQFPSGGSGRNSGFSLSPIGTPKSGGMRTDSRFQSPRGKGTVRKKHIHFEGDENVTVNDAPDQEKKIGSPPTTIQMLGMPSTARGPKPTYRDPVAMMPNWGSLAQGQGDSEDVVDSDSSIGDDFLENLEEDAPETDQLITYRPGLTPRVRQAMASRGGNAY
ncbi:hypothetical protein TWF506_001099 [Arthrobotrys conoides]|uniref:Secreted protein n=1 Tax=Arthrobotrys conoides TaxID=74498 RepID=A0AAN8P1G7_9PEZI